jgi:hypothetical protein
VLRAEWSVVYSCTGATADGARGRAAEAPNAGSRDVSPSEGAAEQAVHCVLVLEWSGGASSAPGRVDAHACSAAPPPVEGGPAGRVR